MLLGLSGSGWILSGSSIPEKKLGQDLTLEKQPKSRSGSLFSPNNNYDLFIFLAGF